MLAVLDYQQSQSSPQGAMIEIMLNRIAAIKFDTSISFPFSILLTTGKIQIKNTNLWYTETILLFLFTAQKELSISWCSLRHFRS
jgi:hypothetical protein